MNNEQNNSGFGIPNQNNNSSQSMMGENTIPGANLMPVGQPGNLNNVNPSVNANGMVSETTFQQANVESNVLTPNPIPTIVSGTPVNPPNIPSTPINTLSNNNMNIATDSMGGVNILGNSVPNMVNEPISSNLNNMQNTDMGLNNGMMMGTELNAQPNLNVVNPTVLEQPVLTPNVPLEQPLLTPNVPLGQPSMGNNINPAMNINLGDATPLSNESGTINDGAEVVSIFKWLGLMILFVIPVVGPIMLLVKAFGKEKNKTIKNYARAQLLLSVIACILMIVLFVVMFVAGFGSAIDSMGISGYNSYYDY